MTNYRAAEGQTVVAVTQGTRVVLGAINMTLCANAECYEAVRAHFRERFPGVGPVDLIACPLWEQMPAEGGG